jgi:hypothetical protein
MTIDTERLVRLTTIPAGRGEIAALLLSATVAGIALLGVTPDSAGRAETQRPRAVVSNSRACPLSPTEEQKAIDIFHDKLMPVLTHPRCFNCHGGVDPTTETGGHLGGAVVLTGKVGQCADCHGLLMGWTLPPTEMRWPGKSERELCMMFKKFETTPDRFVQHVTNDNFPNAPEFQVANAAFKGDAALNTLGEITYEEKTGQKHQAAPPPVSHAQFILDSRDWAYTIGDGFGLLPDCGCKPSGTAWVGKVSMVFTARPEGYGTITERLDTEARFELDSSFLAPGDPALRWKTTSGLLRWSVNATGGQCTTSAAGSAPMRLGGDENPWGLLRIEPNRTGALEYEIAIGPWPDAYEARFIYRCKQVSTGEMIRIPGVMFSFGRWWGHPDGATVSADGKTIKGTFTAPHTMNGESRWVWEFTLVR